MKKMRANKYCLLIFSLLMAFNSVVYAQDEPELAASFCEELSERTPAQGVLLAVSDVSGANGRDYVVADDPEILAQHVSALLNHSPQAQEGSEQEKQDRPPARISA